MPLDQSPETIATAKSLVETLHGAFGPHPGFRPAHSKGHVATGTFTPTPEAASLSSAPHFNAPETPVIVRFSANSGNPDAPENDPGVSPTGLAVRFLLSKDNHKHTDIVGHSANGFPMRTGEGFLGFLQAAGSGKIVDFIKENPTAARFVSIPKPAPVSFAQESYHALHAYKFLSADGKETYVRYHVEPVLGTAYLSDEEVKAKPPTYLFDELTSRMDNPATKTISYKLLAEVAEPGDPTDDITAAWPETRKKVELGTIKVEDLLSQKQSLREQQHIIFDPVPRVQGIEESGDPLIEMRAAVYLISGRERRAAPEI